jgi:hypothetical protein
VIEATYTRTAVQRAADRAEARCAAAVNTVETPPAAAPVVGAIKPKRRGRPPGSKNKQKTIASDETIEATVADDFSDTLAARMRQGESTGAPENPFEDPANV